MFQEVIYLRIYVGLFMFNNLPCTMSQCFTPGLVLRIFAFLIWYIILLLKKKYYIKRQHSFDHFGQWRGRVGAEKAVAVWKLSKKNFCRKILVKECKIWIKSFHLKIKSNLKFWAPIISSVENCQPSVGILSEICLSANCIINFQCSRKTHMVQQQNK